MKVERHGDIVRINVAMRWWYAPVPLWLAAIGNYGGALMVMWYIGSLLVRTIMRIPKPPRAVFEVTDEQLSMELRHPMTGERTIHSWPRQAVAEIRGNRYGSGLYVNVPGQVKQTYLTDVSRQTIAMLETALREALTEIVASDMAADSRCGDPT